jgi:hypothetical protein
MMTPVMNFRLQLGIQKIWCGWKGSITLVSHNGGINGFKYVLSRCKRKIQLFCSAMLFLLSPDVICKKYFIIRYFSHSLCYKGWEKGVDAAVAFKS